MSTDACFFIMDTDPRRPCPRLHTQTQHQPQPTASTSTNHFLVEYSPKPAKLVQHKHHHHQTANPGSAAIHRWLATHQAYTYLPHSDAPLEHSAFSSDEDSESESESESEESEESSESEEDQIFMAPRRQHSAPTIALPPSSSPLPLPLRTSSSVPRRARAFPLAMPLPLRLSAPRPALPVLDRAEATAFTTHDKSHWSDDEDDLSEHEEEEEEWLEDEDDLPALDADSGVPASTSTRSLPIPIECKARVDRAPSEDDEEVEAFDEDASPLRYRRVSSSRKNKIQHGQSFWTPWIADYIAQN